MRVIDYAALLLLAAIWGSSYLFIRVAAPVFGPPTLIDLRVFLAAAALLLAVRLAGRPTHLRPIWRPLLLLGMVNAALPFTLIALAELRLSASLAAILNATTPLFTALVAAIWLRDGLTLRKLVGLALGFCGAVVVVGWSAVHLTPLVVLSAGCSLLAALCYSIGGVYANRRFRAVPLLSLTIGQQLGAGVALLPLALLDHPTHAPSLRATTSLLALALLCTAVAYLLYFHLITHVGPTRTHTYAFLVPPFGVLWGALFLGERVPGGMIVGLVLILAGMALVTGKPRSATDRADSPSMAPAGVAPQSSRGESSGL
jgi:drug/metabolite transporter (DMT)-like permease